MTPTELLEDYIKKYSAILSECNIPYITLLKLVKQIIYDLMQSQDSEHFSAKYYSGSYYSDYEYFEEVYKLISQEYESNNI